MTSLGFSWWRKETPPHKEYRPDPQNRGRSTKTEQVVGIISRCQERDLKWLVDLLRSDPFDGIVRDVRHLLITNHNVSEWKGNAERCTVAILYHTKHHGRVNITDVPGAMYEEELTFISERYGRERVMVVLDDMERTDDEEKQRILKNQPKILSLSSELLLIPENDKEQAARHKLNEMWTLLGGEDEDLLKYNKKAKMEQSGKTLERGPAAPGVKMNPSLETRELTRDPKHGGSSCSGDSTSTKLSDSFGTLNPSSPNQMMSFSGRYNDQREEREPQGKALGNVGDDTQTLPTPTSPKHGISIFSRCPENQYKWLMEKLKEGGHDVHAVGITNKYSDFTAEISRRSFAILYHTQRWGRINVTDVADSLYDKELRDLCLCLGRDNVIVVIDDMKVASSEEKAKMLKGQPSIAEWTKELFLFDTNKTNLSENMKKLRETLLQSKRMWEAAANDKHYTCKLNEKKIPEMSCQSVNQTGDLETENKTRVTVTPHAAGTGEKDLIEFTKKLLENHKKETSALIQRYSLEQEQLESVLNQLQEKERTMQDLLRSSHEKDLTIQEQVQSLRDKERTIQDLKKVLRDTEQTKQDLEQSLREKERTIQNQAQSLNEKERTIKNQEKTLNENRETLQEQEGITNELTKELEDRANIIKRLERTIQEQAQSLKEKCRNEGIEESNNKVIQSTRKEPDGVRSGSRTACDEAATVESRTYNRTHNAREGSHNAGGGTDPKQRQYYTERGATTNAKTGYMHRK